MITAKDRLVAALDLFYFAYRWAKGSSPGVVSYGPDHMAWWQYDILDAVKSVSEARRRNPLREMYRD